WFDTGKTLYEKLEKEALKLFQQTWPDIKSRRIKGKRQMGKGSFHQVKDLEKIGRINLISGLNLLIFFTVSGSLILSPLMIFDFSNRELFIISLSYFAFSGT
ncbi:unnamed protein product, partial [marine sediment metagenome]